MTNMKIWAQLAIALYLTFQPLSSLATTIAYDGHILAADSQLTMTAGKQERKLLNCQKIHYSARHQAWVACAGNVEDINTFLNYFINGKSLPAGWVGEFEALVVYKTGICELYILSDKHHMVMPIPIAIGSGEDAAMAAIYAGKRADEAIAVAELVDMYTGGPVTIVHVKP